MKKLLFITVCLMLLYEGKCYARIGETLEECEKRYGKRIAEKEKLQDYANWMLGVAFSRVDLPKIFGERVSDKFDENGGLKIKRETYYFFRLDEFVICVKLYNDKVDAIRFMKSYPEYDNKPIRRMMSEDEKMALISANSNGEKCVNFIFSSFTDVLVIYTEEYNNKIEKQKELLKKEEDEKQKNVLKKF
jgi:hypothetical protein